MMHKIILFTLNGCGHCKSLKKRLDKLSILYTDIEVNSNPDIWNSVVKQTGQEVIPMVFIKQQNSNSGPIYVPGRDYQTEDEIVEIIKNILNTQTTQKNPPQG